jgi:hypothetical protein
MPLLDLKTDLKSLRYGNDTPGGGDSGQPYIKTDINTVDSGINKLRFTKFDDGLIRGGAIGVINSGIVDTLRIGKFLTDFPKGPLFITKQIGLQLSNPRLESKELRTNRPTNGQGVINNVGNFISNIANKIENEVGPTRIYNLGVNTLAQIPVNALGGHIVRHGFLPNTDESKYYFNVVTENNKNGTNRLLIYSKELIGNSNDIDSYLGGPGSVYGIGNTTIRRRGNYIQLNQDTTDNAFATTGSFTLSKDLAGKTRNNNGSVEPLQMQYKFKGASNFSSSIYASGSFPFLGDPLGLDDRNAASNINEDKTGIYHVLEVPIKIKDTKDFEISTFTSSSLSKNRFNLTSTTLDNSFIYNVGKDEDKNKNQYTLQLGNNDLPPLRNINDTNQNSGPSTYPGTDATSTENKDGVLSIPALVYNYANPALKKYSELRQQVESKNIIKQNNFSTKLIFNNRNSNTYKYNTGTKVAFNRVNDRQLDKDEIKVIFSPIQPFTGKETPIQFLSYLTNYSENYDSDWGDTKYVGRAESFYIFKGFKKTVSLGLHVPCFNSDELTKNHAKLFKLGGKSLAYALAGQYNENSLLGGVIIRLTVGNYLVKSPGIITSLKFDIVDGSSWDLSKKYAHILKIDIGFTVIGNELPVYESTTFAAPPKDDPPKKTDDDPPVDDDNIDPKEIPIATTDYLGSGAGFERAGGNTDAQRAFRERQLDNQFGF